MNQYFWKNMFKERQIYEGLDKKRDKLIIFLLDLYQITFNTEKLEDAWKISSVCNSDRKGTGKYVLLKIQQTYTRA